MKRKYVLLNKSGVWHVGTATIWTMCGRAMSPDENDVWRPYRAKPWVAIADEPDGPLCKVCAKALAAWERDFGEAEP